jgi:phospholipid transport system substrate-binding protein
MDGSSTSNCPAVRYGVGRRDVLRHTALPSGWIVCSLFRRVMTAVKSLQKCRPAIAALLLLFCFTGPAMAIGETADAFVRRIGGEAIKVMTDAAIKRDDREARFRELLHEAFDMEMIGRLVLSRYWRVATPTERTEFLKLFEEHLVQVYTSRFEGYPGVGLKVAGLRKDQESEIVQSSIVRPGNAPPVALDWRIQSENSRLLVSDLVVEGISMVITQRSEFASVIQQSGGKVEGLIAALRKRTGK